MLKKMVVFLLSFVFVMSSILVASPTVQATSNTYYVSTTGNDSNPGTINSPFLTIQKASSVMVAGDTALIRGGTYHETITPTNNGTVGAPITYKAYTGETVTISGSDPITGWTLDSGSLYKAPMNWDLGDKNQVFVNGEMMRLAQFPNWTNDADLFDVGWDTMDSGTATSITDASLNKPANYWVGATVIVKGWWSTQSAKITSSNGTTINFSTLPWSDQYTNPAAGVKYMIAGVKGQLDRQKEWYYDPSASTLYLWAPGGVNPNTLTVEAKKREFAIDLSGKSYINVEGLHILGATISTTNASNNTIKGVNAKYVSHTIGLQTAYYRDNTGIILEGTSNTIRDSEISYSSGNGVIVRGNNNNVINNYIHETDYMGTYNASIALDGGKQHLIAYNTAKNTGRDIIQISNVDDVIIEYNDISFPGKLSMDLGAIYVVGEDGGNSEIRYNYIHDVNVHLGTGVYFDNNCSNFFFHHNTIWNTPQWSSFYIGGLANFMFAYDNVVDGSISVNTTDIKYGTRVYNNVSTGGVVNNPETALVYNNSIATFNPNAYPTAGHNFTSPPNPVYQHSNPMPDFRNLALNFEFQNGFENYTLTGNQNVTYTTTGSQGRNNFDHSYAMFGTGQNGVEQTVTGLLPNTTYEFSGWARAASSEEVWLGVKNYGGNDVHQSVTNAGWSRKSITFTTGATDTSATFYAWKNSTGSGVAYAQDFGLTLSQLNLARSATVSATSLSANSSLQPKASVDGSSTTAYVSAENPTFPQYLTLNWAAGQDFNSASIQCTYCQGQGITNFDVQVSVDGSTNWTTVASSGSLSYATNNSTLETKTVTFTGVSSQKGMRIKVNNANLQYLHYVANELQVFAPVNIALSKPATSSSSYSASQQPELAVDGVAATKWSSQLGETHWLQVDLGQSYNVSRYVVKHAGAFETWGTQSLNTKDFKFQISADGTSWTDVDTVTGNTSNVTDHNVSTTGRYVRLYITNPQSETTYRGARIYEFIVNGAPSTAPTNVALNKTATASSSYSSGSLPALAVDGSTTTKWSSQYGETHWLQVDLGQSYNLSRYVVTHAGANETWGTASLNTKDFKFQVSNDGSTWSDVDTVTGNTANVTDHNVSASGRYVRLNITNPQTETTYRAARIFDFVVYGN